MFEQFHAQIHEQAKAAYPNEAVWLISGGECHQVENIAEKPTKHMAVSKQVMRNAQARGLEAVIHSHPDGPDCPSEHDMRGQIHTAVPWGIVSTDGQYCLPIFWWGDDVPILPLKGRGFRHGVTDCYSLIRDYYRMEKGILIPEFPRSWDWWHHDQDLYVDGFPKAGFVKLDVEKIKLGEIEPQEGDMWFSQLRSNVPNHGGIYMGDETILHHATSRKAVDPARMSAREPIHRWLPHITHWLRHKELA